MASEKCVFCGDIGTPWEKLSGHICFDCYCESKEKRGENEDKYDEQKEWACSKL